MPRNFARHEQFLRVFALLDALFSALGPVDDETLINLLKDRLGLKQLSVRTLHRDCDFLASCGYPVDHVRLPGGRRQGWLLDRVALAARKIPAEPLTLLELVAFTIGRDLLRPFEGTVLWTGIESLRHKFERALPPQMLERLESARSVFHVADSSPSRYASRPRLISSLSRAVADRREIDVTTRAASGATTSHRLQPLQIVVDPPRVRLLALETQPAGDRSVLIDLEHVDTAKPLDATFAPPAIDMAEMIARAVVRP